MYRLKLGERIQPVRGFGSEAEVGIMIVMSDGQLALEELLKPKMR